MPAGKKALYLLSFILVSVFHTAGAGTSASKSYMIRMSMSGDSIEKQILFNGKIWNNLYHATEGHQFFSSREFLPGSVSMSSKIFNNSSLRFKLDLVNDELLLSADMSTVVQLNKEMVDFFTLETEGATFRFVRLEADSINSLSGYFHILYSGSANLYVSYRKELRLRSSVGERDTFIQSHTVYLVRDEAVNRISGRTSLMKLLADKKIQVRKFIRSEKIRISRTNPGSMVPILEFYDGLK